MKLELLKENFNKFLSSINESGNFSKIDATYLNIVGDENSVNELMGDTDPENKNIYKYKSAKDVQAGLSNMRTGGGTLATQKKMGYVHNKYLDAISIKNENGESYDLDKLKSIIKTRPSKLLIQNEKMMHGSVGAIRFFNIGLPALKSLVVDEKTDEFVLVNTCPGAGQCILDCYALKGSFIVFKGVAISRARKLNFLINDPEGYKKQIIKELGNKIRSEGKKGIKVVLRWHDAGDFFMKQYIDMAIEIANEFPQIEFYAYTKRAIAVNINAPDNLVIRFSDESTPKEREQVDYKTKLLAHIVPLDMFKDLFLIGKNGRPYPISNTDKHWIYKDPEEKSIETLKQRIADKYNLDVSKVLTHDEFMDNKSYHTGDPEWHVIIRPGDSDFPAKMKSAKAVYNLKH